MNNIWVYLIFIIMPIQAIDHTETRSLVNLDDCVWDGHEAEKDSAASQMHLINHHNEQKLRDLREAVALLYIPEIVSELSAKDYRYGLFLQQQLWHYEKIHVHNLLLGQLCYYALTAPKTAFKAGNKLPSIPNARRAQYSRQLLVSYDKVVLAHGTTKLKYIFRKQIVPDETVLRSEWERKFKAAVKFNAAADDPVEAPMETVATGEFGGHSCRWDN